MAADEAGEDEGAEGPDADIDQDDQDGHGGGRGGVAGVVHIGHGHRSQGDIGRVEEDDGGDGGHGIDEEELGDFHDGRQAHRYGDAPERAVEGHAHGFGHGLVFGVELAQGGRGREGGDRGEVGDVAEHEDAHGGVEEMERIGDGHSGQGPARRIEKENVGQTDDEAGQGQGQEGEQGGALAQPGEAPGFLDAIGRDEGDGGAEDGRVERHAGAAPQGRIAAASHVAEAEMGQGQGEIVGPDPDQGGKKARPQVEDETQGDAAAVGQIQPVDPGALLRGQGHGAGGDQGGLAVLEQSVQEKSRHRGQQQDHADRGAHGEMLLADDLLVDVRGQDIVLAAHDLGGAEVGEGQDEAGDGGGKESVPRPGQGHGPKDAQAGGPHGSGRLVESGVGGGQGHGQDEHGLGKGVDRFGDDDADRAVESDVQAREQPEQAGGDKSLAAEKIDEVDAEKERRRKKRRHGQTTEKALGRKGGPGQGVGVGEAQGHGQGGGHAGDEQAVPKRSGQGGLGEKGAEIGQADPHPCGVLKAFGQDLGQGQAHGAKQPQYAEAKQEGTQALFGKKDFERSGGRTVDGGGRRGIHAAL